MLARWTRYLPFFLVEMISKRKCERFRVELGGQWDVVMPFNDCMIFIGKRPTGDPPNPIPQAKAV